MSALNLIDEIIILDDEILVVHNFEEIHCYKENQIREVKTIKKGEKLSISHLYYNSGPGWYYFRNSNKICKSLTVKEDKKLSGDYLIQFKYRQEFLYFGIFKKDTYFKSLNRKTIISIFFKELKLAYRRIRTLPLVFFSQFFKQRKDLILAGENEGNPTEGNGLYFFYDLEKDNIYFVSKKIKDVKKKKNLVKYNSIKHLYIFFRAKNLVFSQGPMDVVPTIFHKAWYTWNKHNSFFLNHGTFTLKRVGYGSKDYYGSIKGFVVSNPIEFEICEEILGFTREQLIPSCQPIYDHYEIKKKDKRIFVMPTWGDYGKSDSEILDVFWDAFKDLPEEILNNYEIIFKVHPYTNPKVLYTLKDGRIGIGEKSIKHYIETSEIVVTDYSSIVWNAIYCNCKVINYFHNFIDYAKERDLYVPLDYLKQVLNICMDKKEFQDKLTKIINEKQTYPLPYDFTPFGVNNRSEIIYQKILSVIEHEA